MNRFTFLRSLATIMACLALALPASAYDFVKDGIYYVINGTNVFVTYKDTNYNSYSGTVIIPSTVTNNGTTYNVVQINPSAFKNCAGLKRVVLPPTIKNLMNYAFQNCTGLTNITLPADFYACYNYVFDGCTNLKSIIYLSPTARNWNMNNFPESVLSRATLIVPQGKKDAYQSVGGCLSAFTNIEEMDCDFAEDAIFYKDMGNNKVAVTHALRFAEDYSGDIEIPEVVVHDGTTYNVTSVGNEAFYYGHELYSVKLPSTVNSIDSYAFYDCYNMTQVNIPEGVEYINYCTFGGCLALQEIIIPSSVTWIAQNAFVSCTNLTNITCRAITPPMCASSNSFPSEAFANATLNVPSLSLNAYQTADVWKEFSHIVASTYDFTYDNLQFVITSPTTAKVVGHVLPSPAGYYSIPSTANGYNVTEVGDYAFQNCNQITEMSIGDNVVTIGRVAFEGCSGLTSLTIPNSVTRIDIGAFMGCSGLTSVVIPNSVTYVGGKAFSDCSSLTSVIIGKNCRFNTSYSTALSVFEGTTGLTSVTSLSPVAWNMDASNFEQSVYNNAQLWVPKGSKSSYQSTDSWNQFSNIVELEYDFEYDGIYYNITGSNTVEVTYRTSDYNSYSDAVYIPATVPYNGKTYTVTAIGQNAFKMSKSMFRVVMPNTIRSINAYAFHYCEGLTEVVIPNSVQTIGSNAFWLCLNLKNVVIPNSVQTIGSMAFRNCSELTSVEIGENVTSIGSTCFYYCNKITEVTCHAVTPPTLNEPNDNNTTFSPSVYSSAVLNVPLKSMTAYQNALGWKRFTNFGALINLDDALNVDGGDILFTSVGDYPWFAVYEGGRIYAQSGNAGIHSSSSVLTATVNLDSPGILSFDFKAWGEGNDPIWDVCSFDIDGVEQFRYGAYDNDWETYSVYISQGSHTLTWSYIKDSSVNASGDYFAVDNVAITLADVQRGDVNKDGAVNIADVTSLIDYLLGGDEGAISLGGADVNEDGTINIADVTSLIDYLLSGVWPGPAPIDMWYLTGDRVGSNPWENQGESSVGRGLIPLYPVEELDDNGQGQLAYTGFFGASDAVMLIHHPGSNDDCWGYTPNGVFGRGGDEISGIATGNDGYFNIWLNTKTNKFYFFPYTATTPVTFGTINIVGTHSGWVVTDTDYNMTPLNPNKENHNWIFRNFTLASDGEVKFAANNGWDDNWGLDAFPFGRGERDGFNIPVKAGTYDVYFNDITGDFNFIKK